MKARILAAIAAFFVFFICSAAQAARDDVLIIVNENSKDSRPVGEFYAQQRSVPAKNIVPVKTINRGTLSWLQFQSLRDQILRNGICPSVPLDKKPAACADATLPIYTVDNINALTTNTPIRYIITTRGIPLLFTPDAASAYGTEPTSVDNYLKFWLARHFASDTKFNFTERKAAFGDGRGMRTVIPAFDKEYIIGRIDGVDQESAKALVSRAIAAESNGIYGKLYGSTFGSTGGTFSWQNYATNQYIYGDEQTSWRYTFGLFGEGRPECSDYQNSSHYFAFSPSTTSGKSPDYCLAHFNKGNPNESIAGLASSRQPIALDALAYFGSLDGQSIAGGFNTYLNWRKDNASCSPTLCTDAPDPASCRAASIDPYKEINTQCVGVADGFIGYNFQSYPVQRPGISPTSWDSPFTYVLSDTGYDDNYSIWGSNPDEVLNPQCPTYANNILGTTLQPCDAVRVADIKQTISVTSIDPNSPPTYTFSYYRIGKNISSSGSHGTTVTFIYTKTAGIACPTGLSGGINDSSCKYKSSPTDPSTEWIRPTNTFGELISRKISPPANTGLSFTSIEILIHIQTAYGSIGIDQVSLQNTADASELVTNGSFNQGHKQTASGDFATNFLDRLGGTAFWGSLSHHESNGHSFDSNSMGTLVYFMRGLPLGDAVWLGDTYNSGVFYGDPLYSPASVKFNYLQDPAGTFIGSIALYGDTINGKDPTRVSTTYSIDYCPGTNFYTCDQQYLWNPTGISGTGGQFNQFLGTWNASSLTNGSYLLRLNVTSNNLLSGKTQSFFDYLPVKKRDAVISGTIRDNTGQALAGVKLAINDNFGFTSSLTTDNHGYYAGTVPKSGLYLVYPTKSGHTILAVTGNLFQSVNNQDVKNKDFLATARDYVISGTIKDQNGQAIPGMPVAINDNYGFTSTSTTNSNGYFAQGGLKNGTYLVYPTLTGYTFTPVSGTVFQAINGASISNKNFIGSKPCCSISGTIKTETGLPLPNVEVSINNNSGYSGKALTDSNGYYTWGGLDNGLYLVYPTFSGCTFLATTGNALASINGANVTGKNFTGTCN